MIPVVISFGLAAIVGPENVISDPAHLGAYRSGGETPSLAVRPASNQEVAEVVRFAAAERLAVVPVGAATKLSMAISLRACDVALDTTRLDRVIAYDPDDLTLSVEAGMPLERLAGVLAGHRQFLPLGVPFMNRATVGGTIASGMDSPLRQFYGTARDYVLGMEFVTGEAHIVNSGGRVVKNVSGYDLHKLLIGSLGSLGVITKVNFRTFPMPPPIRVFIAFFDSAAQALEMRHRLAILPLRPLVVEVLSPQAGALLSSNMAAQIEPGRVPDGAFSPRHWATLFAFAGTEHALKRCDQDLRQIAGVAEVIAHGDDSASTVLGRVREFIPIALACSPGATIVKMSIVPMRVGQLLDVVASAAEKATVRWAAIARGVGVTYSAFLPEAISDDARARVASAIEQLDQACRRSDGNLTILWRPDPWTDSLPSGKTERDDLDQMHKLKQVFDPCGVFAPDLLARWQ